MISVNDSGLHLQIQGVLMDGISMKKLHLDVVKDKNDNGTNEKIVENTEEKLTEEISDMGSLDDFEHYSDDDQDENYYAFGLEQLLFHCASERVISDIHASKSDSFSNHSHEPKGEQNNDKDDTLAHIALAVGNEVENEDDSDSVVYGVMKFYEPNEEVDQELPRSQTRKTVSFNSSVTTHGEALRPYEISDESEDEYFTQNDKNHQAELRNTKDETELSDSSSNLSLGDEELSSLLSKQTKKSKKKLRIMLSIMIIEVSMVGIALGLSIPLPIPDKLQIRVEYITVRPSYHPSNIPSFPPSTHLPSTKPSESPTIVTSLQPSPIPSFIKSRRPNLITDAPSGTTNLTISFETKINKVFSTNFSFKTNLDEELSSSSETSSSSSTSLNMTFFNVSRDFES